MPHAHVDSVIQALSEPWFYGGPRNAGANYGKELLSKFNARRDKDALDAGLGLGNYLVHSEANKRQRVVLRAAMLANVLMRDRPATELPAAKQRFQSLPLDALKRAFINQFPVLDNGARGAWDVGQFTDPILLPDLRTCQSWVGKTVPPYMFIVHSNESPQLPSAVFRDPIGEISKYNASSFSVMSSRKPFTYFPQGLIFRVPANNVLVTHHSDVGSVLRENSVHGPKFSKQTFAEEITELSMATGSGGMSTPLELISQQDKNRDSVGVKSRYNELLICGTPGMTLPHGISGALRLKGVFITITKDGNIAGPPFNAAARLAACEEHARRLKVPMLYLPNVA